MARRCERTALNGTMIDRLVVVVAVVVVVVVVVVVAVRLTHCVLMPKRLVFGPQCRHA